MKAIVVALITILLLITVLAGVGHVTFVSANPDGSFPALSMPVEYVNYTVTTINGTLWGSD